MVFTSSKATGAHERSGPIPRRPKIPYAASPIREWNSKRRNLPMKTGLVAMAICLGSATGVVWAKTDTLTSLTAIHALSNEQASRHIPVAFEATVTYYRDYERTLFVQDGDTAIFALTTTGLKLRPGDRVLVRGNN